MLNDKILDKVIQSSLNEALGINPLVVKATDDIMDKVLSAPEDQMLIIPPRETLHCTLKSIAFDYVYVNEVSINVVASIVDFQEEKELFDFFKKYPMEYQRLMTAKTFKSPITGMLGIKFFAIRIGGKVIFEIYERLQHELEHVFQRIMKNGDLSSQRYKRDTDIMRKSKDVLLRKVGRINYLSYRHEQDAMANGLYSILTHIKCDVDRLDEVIQKTAFYRTLNEIKRAVVFWEGQLGNEATEQVLLQNFSYGVDVVLRRAKKAANEFVKRLGRVKTYYLQQLDV